MKILLLVSALLAASSLHAQHFSAGARSGAGFWKGEAYNKETFENAPQRTLVWEKEIFMRYESAKHLAFEIGVNRVEAESDGVVFGLCGVGLPDNYSWTSERTFRDTYYGLNLRLQYGFSCPHIRRLSNYPGIAITPSLYVKENREIVQNISPGKVSEETIITTNRELSMQLAVEDMIRYHAAEHIDVHCLIGYKVNVGSTSLQKAFAVQLGVAYRF